MATTFKTFLNNDITSTKTLLHESIPLTGALVSGTYGTWPNGGNIKNYAHGMFQGVYDYPYLSSSANHIFDLTVGYSSNSPMSSSTSSQNKKKINIYNQMAQVLVGYDQTGSIKEFESSSYGHPRECVFISFARLLGKDEIKKGSFSLTLGSGTFDDANTYRVTIADTNAQNEYRVNSPAGEYGILSMSSGADSSFTTPECGYIFYQAGIVVLTASIFIDQPNGGLIPGASSGELAAWFDAGNESITGSLTGSAISGTCDGFRHRIYDMSFNNTTELNSTIHFCRINHNDYNYSANPTYLSSSKIVVKNNTLDAPVSYITTVGLYSADNELLAVAKLSEALKKDPTNEMTLRVRLDY